MCACFISPPQHEEQTGEQDRRSRTEEVAHGHLAGCSGSARGELSKDPELSGRKTEGVIGLVTQHMHTHLHTSVAQRSGLFFCDVTEFCNFQPKPCKVSFISIVFTCVSLEKKASNLKGFVFTSGYLSLHPELVRALFLNSDGGMSHLCYAMCQCSSTHSPSSV